MPFLLFLKSFEVLLYEVMSWVVFYPRTLWRSLRHPLRMMGRGEHELKLPTAEQFKDVVSPPIFLLLTVVAANAVQVAILGNNPLIDNGIGLASLITDNTSLILFRLVAFSLLPAIAGALALKASRQALDRETLQPFFYAQCYATTPVVFLASVGETLTRLSGSAGDFGGAFAFVAAALFYIGVVARWFMEENKRGIVAGLVWAIAVYAVSMILLGGIVLMFVGQ